MHCVLSDAAKEWNPVPFLSARSDTGQASEIANLKIALVIINTPIVRKDIFETIWKNCMHLIHNTLHCCLPHMADTGLTTARTHCSLVKILR